jgi:AcrR family transcriptional regulator
VPSAASSRRARDGGESAAAPATRDVILDTAERLFAARGVDGIAVRDLARAMDMTASSLYNHFPSKQALYDAVLERGLRPIVDLVTEAWDAGSLRSAQVGATLDRLTAHLARHPHLAPLLQRALLEEPGALEGMIERWVGSLYRQGVAVLRIPARRAGWEAAEVPHLGVALFGLIFAYFTNAGGLQRLAGWTDDPLAPRGLAVQRRFLGRAVLRLLGPRPQGLPRRGAARTGAAARRRRTGDG